VTRIEEALKKVTGRAWTLRIEVIPTAAVVGDAPSVSTLEAPLSLRPARRHPKEEAEKEPLVQRALEVLGAQILRADEGFGTKPPDTKLPGAATPDNEET
jgi:hypothetical protein